MEKNKNNLVVYISALKQYGISAQQWMLVEEVGELLNAIAKLKRNRCTKADVITELADVHIMVEQMALLYGWEDFKKEKELKLIRLEERLRKTVNNIKEKVE